RSSVCNCPARPGRAEWSELVPQADRPMYKKRCTRKVIIGDPLRETKLRSDEASAEPHFSFFNVLSDPDAMLKFCMHDQNWTVRFIRSLQMLASLAEKGGEVRAAPRSCHLMGFSCGRPGYTERYPDRDDGRLRVSAGDIRTGFLIPDLR
ncbi:MAG TPA: hypothetical protein VGC80_06630, partial [Acetobacteraceae bacterium]